MKLGEGLVNGEPIIDDSQENINTRTTVGSGSIYVDTHCRGQKLVTMSQTQVCYTTENGASADVQALPSNCRVVVFDDKSCTEEPFTLVGKGRTFDGCFASGDGFNSAKLICSY